MKKKYIIKDSEHIEYLIKKGQFVKYGPFVVYYAKKRFETERQYAFLVAKKFRTKVERNYYKRLLREMTRVNREHFDMKYDYALLFRYQEKKQSYDMYEQQFNIVLKKIKERQQWVTTKSK
ncbi:MAG: ribonuclease P protein component [Culicoidibacterales bacterium]